MPLRGNPNVHARQLAAELRRLREGANHTGDQVASAMHWSPSKVSRIETGIVKVKAADLRLLLDLYEVPDEKREGLLTMAKQSAEPLPADAAGRSGYLEGFEDYLDAEASAIAIREWEPQVVPGLLQTADYARESMLGWNEMENIPPSELDLKVERRIARQETLIRHDAPILLVVLDEAVIRRRQGSNATMRRQLERIAECATLPTVKIRVLPLDVGPAVNSGSFVHMQFAKDAGQLPHDVVYLEHLFRTHYVDDVTETYKYEQVFEKLQSRSLDATHSIHLVKEAAREYG